MAHNYFVVTVINIPFVLLITTFTYEGWRYKSRAFESEVSDFLLSARRLLKWDQCSGCMTTQTPSLLTVPFCYDCFHRCGLVHVWLQSVHGERTAHCPVCMFFRDGVNYVSGSFFSQQHSLLGLSYWLYFERGTKLTPFLKGQSFLKASFAFWRPSFALSLPSECLTKQTCIPQGRNCRHVCSLSGTPSPSAPASAGPQSAFALKSLLSQYCVVY